MKSVFCFLVVLFVLSGGIVTTEATAKYCFPPTKQGATSLCLNLIEPQNRSGTFGTLCFYTNETDPTWQVAKVTINQGNELASARLWVGSSFDKSPRAKNGAPNTKAYPFSCMAKRDTPRTCSMGFSVPLSYGSGDPCGHTITYAAYVVIYDKYGALYNSRDLWTVGTGFPIKNSRGTFNANYGKTNVLCDSQCP